MKPRLTSQQVLVLELRSQGMKFREIALRIGLSKQRAYQIHAESKRRLATEHWTNGLSTRNKNVLRNLNINSREEAGVAYESGRLSPFKTRYYGNSSHKEMGEWLKDHPAPPAPKAHQPEATQSPA